MAGFIEDFIGVDAPLPKFSNAIKGDILTAADIEHDLRENYYRDYINYSVAIDKIRRSPIVVAANIDQSKIKKGIKRGAWWEDTIIGRAYQLNNDYYRNRGDYKNRWDRGHLARRSSAAWGETRRDAHLASDDTMVYTNAHLQWDMFNQDEWLGIEEWVRTLDDDENNKISVFTGPIYENDPIFVMPPGREPAEVPAAFFKVVCFKHRDFPNDLSVRAFTAYQDKDAKRDKRGFDPENLQFYQTTVAQIEEKTGLIFDEKIAEKNPLLYNENVSRGAELNIARFPENNPVDRAVDVTDPDGTRIRVADADVDIFIAGALVNPTGADAGAEWVSIVNLKDTTANIDGWTLTDNGGEVVLGGTIEPGATLLLKGEALSPIRLGNGGDILTLFDQSGRRVDRAVYRARDVREGRAIVFGRRS